jgi:pimeloyl-ACP methyl ester carboxylesterase
MRTAASPEFAALREGLRQYYKKVVPVDISWNRKTVSSFADTFADVYERHKGKHNTVLGNSLGAMAAFVSAPVLHPDQLLLASLSAFFKEDLVQYSSVDLRRRPFAGKRRLKDFKHLSAKALAKEINVLDIPITLFFGEHEKKRHPELVARVKETARDVHRATLIELPNTGHSMRRPDYTTALLREIGKMKV